MFELRGLAVAMRHQRVQNGRPPIAIAIVTQNDILYQRVDVFLHLVVYSLKIRNVIKYFGSLTCSLLSTIYILCNCSMPRID